MNNMRDLIDEVKSRSDIVNVISQYISLKNSGSSYSGLCPFHSEKTGSFHVNKFHYENRKFGLYGSCKITSRKKWNRV